MNEAADFKSAVYTNFTTQAKPLLSLKKPCFLPSAAKAALGGPAELMTATVALQACIRLTA
jgi:hypothetical protein